MEIKPYKLFFGLEKEAFRADIGADEILQTPELTGAQSRFEYATDLGAAYLITGEIGAGKSTAIRHLLNQLHPSGHKVIYVTATTGSILELYRLIQNELGLTPSGVSRAAMISQIKREVLDLVTGKKINVVLVVDEASLLRLEVFAELHTLCQFEIDSKPYLPLVLAGQSTLIDKLSYPGSMPLASRIVAKSHFVGAERDQMQTYLRHHLSIAGVKTMLFDDTAVTAIHQGSAGIYRKANNLARGALIAAAMDQKKLVSAVHVQIAASEIF
jgi:type II secretory pathway predicted ATPase ExeA